MYCACTVCVLCMYCVCTVCVLCVYCACTVCVLCMYCVCTVHVLCVYCACTVYVLCMYGVCTVQYTHFPLQQRSVRAQRRMRRRERLRQPPSSATSRINRPSTAWTERTRCSQSFNWLMMSGFVTMVIRGVDFPPTIFCFS